MNIYKWYFIFNSTEFNATGLISRTLTVNLDGIGLKSILITKGQALGITYEGVFLSLEMAGKNPFEFDGHAIYIDTNQNVWLGFLQGDA